MHLLRLNSLIFGFWGYLGYVPGSCWKIGFLMGISQNEKSNDHGRQVAASEDGEAWNSGTCLDVLIFCWVRWGFPKSDPYGKKFTQKESKSLHSGAKTEIFRGSRCVVIIWKTEVPWHIGIPIWRTFGVMPSRSWACNGTHQLVAPIDSPIKKVSHNSEATKKWSV